MSFRDIIIEKTGRGSKIRTYDPLVPNQVRYQTAPCPDGALLAFLHLKCNALLLKIVKFMTDQRLFLCAGSLT